MSQPTGVVTVAWIVVGPVDYSAFVIPLIFTPERYSVAFQETVDTRCQINIVRHKHRLSRCES